MYTKQSYSGTCWLVLFFFMTFCLYSCTGPQPVTYDMAAAGSDLPPAQTATLTRLLGNYNQLKDALVAGNSKKTGTAALAAKTSLRTLLQDSTIHIQSPATDTLLLQLDKILAERDETCEHQRIHFRQLSSSLYTFLKQNGLRHVTVYRQYCPMALNELGATWLSASPDIENPYYGAKMLSCGEVTDTLR